MPVHHIVIYNVDADAQVDVAEMMAEGQRVLSGIPGVREVFTGCAMGDKSRYAYSWNIRFCHPAVVDSYREHPDHKAFADTWFRSVASDRISIDFVSKQASRT